MKSRITSDEMTVACDPHALREMRLRVGEMWTGAGLPAAEGHLVVLAVDEAVSALVNHARETQRGGDIRVRIDLDGERFRALIEDRTDVLPPGGAPKGDTQRYLNREREHELGVFLMSAIMDEVFYHYRRGSQNEIELRRFVRAGAVTDPQKN